MQNVEEINKNIENKTVDKQVCQRLPSFIPDEEGGGILTFEYVFDRNGNEKYRDGIKKNNTYIYG